MALIRCNDCGKEISEYAEFCPHCGAKNSTSQPYTQNGYNASQVNPDCWEYGGGAKFWMGLCMVAQALTGIVALSQSQVLAGLLGIASAVCFGILWLKKNVYGFYGICAIAFIMMLINFANNMGIFSLNPANFGFCSSCSCKKPRSKSDSIIWTCQKCGTGNSTTTRFCSKCGANKPVEVNNQMWTCADCGQSNKGIYNTCQSCGSSRPRNTSQKSVVTNSQTTSTLTATAAVTSQQPSATSKFCSSCGEKLQEGVRFCPNCGRNVNDTSTGNTASQDYIGQARDAARRAANTVVQKGSQAVNKAKGYIDSKH